MFWFFGAAALSFVLTAAFGILPDADFLPWPDAVPAAFETVGNWAGYMLGLLGAEMSEAIITCGQVLIGVYLMFFVLDVLRYFNIPVFDRFIGRWGRN